MIYDCSGKTALGWNGWNFCIRFRTMRNLYLSKEVSRHVAPALQQELSEENVTEVLRALQNAYRAIGHRDLFKKPSDSSLMPDSRLVTGTP